MSIQEFLARWDANRELFETTVARRSFPAQPAVCVNLPEALPQALHQALVSSGISRLYEHQYQAWQAAHEGDHVVLTTGTASGKSLAYNLCSLAALESDPQATALYLFPTKALAQDQSTKISHLISQKTTTPFLNLNPQIVGIYDGDTKSAERQRIRQHARLLISNPDMLHIGILPHHTRWAEFFRGLRYVVLDEIHIYRGVFGSHVANVIRRLSRIAQFYGSAPQFIFTSATIGNAADLAAKLIETKVTLISNSKAARGAKEFVILNPPVVNRELGLRRSVLQECQILSSELESYDLQSLVFVRSRRSVEILVRYLQETSSLDRKEIRGYRSGYLPPKRREIEYALRSGQARHVVATNALELGIDIGGLEAVVLGGYPGSIASTWQQAGRAGRSEQDRSLVFLILGSNPLDQFLAQHPEYVFDNNPERALINPDHPLIFLQHLQCAAYELPFTAGDTFGCIIPADLQEILEHLVNSGALHHAKDKYFWVSDQFPAADISLRSASSDKVLVQEKGSTIADIDLHSAYWMVHPDAIYLHDGRSYHVQSLDLERKIAAVEAVDYDFYTEAVNNTSFELDKINLASAIVGGDKYHCDVTVTSQVTGFKRIQWETHATLSRESLEMPAVELFTEGYLLSIDAGVIEHLRQKDLWTNDPIDYGPNWITARSLAIARDRNNCQICGTSAEQSRLHVHHKIPFRTFPSYIEANHLPNLVTLCPGCHQKVEQNLRIRSGLAGLGYLLVNLAPLFLMCDRNDLGLHTDPRSPLLDQTPVVLIYELIPAGIGLCQEIYHLHDQLIDHAYELVTGCPCLDGCPSCVGPAGENGVGGKKPAAALIRALIATK